MKNFWPTLKKPIIALAPMEGVTDSVFRQLVKEFGADVVYTEFVSADALGHQSRTAFKKLEFEPLEQPVVCQIFGRDPVAFRLAAKEIENRGFAGVDINLGCPARKVVGHGAGVALMRQPEYARQLVIAVLETVNIPVSIKLRSRIRKERSEIVPDSHEYHTALDLIEAIDDLPVSAIMIHGRSFEDPFASEIDLQMIAQAKKRFNGLVLANGGIKNPNDALDMLKKTKADGVGIARGALGQPWIFGQIKELIDLGEFHQVNWQKINATVQQHAASSYAKNGQRGLIEFRKHLSWYLRGFPGAASIRRLLPTINSLSDVTNLLAVVNTAQSHNSRS